MVLMHSPPRSAALGSDVASASSCQPWGVKGTGWFWRKAKLQLTGKIFRGRDLCEWQCWCPGGCLTPSHTWPWLSTFSVCGAATGSLGVMAESYSPRGAEHLETILTPGAAEPGTRLLTQGCMAATPAIWNAHSAHHPPA